MGPFACPRTQSRPFLVFASMSCAGPSSNPRDFAVCTSLLSLNTEWHKKTDVSTLAASFWMNPTEYTSNADQVREWTAPYCSNVRP